VSRLAPEDISKLTSQNQKKEANFATDEKGLPSKMYISAVSHSVQYLSGGPEDLVVRPETIAPPIGRTSKPLAGGGSPVCSGSQSNHLGFCEAKLCPGRCVESYTQLLVLCTLIIGVHT
jgi:hypothetical protein